MRKFRLEPGADACVDQIYDYTYSHWSVERADDYILALFAEFEAIADGSVPRRPIPAELDVDGYFRKSRHHFIYWKVMADGEIAIVAILHERMHQMARLQAANPRLRIGR